MSPDRDETAHLGVTRLTFLVIYAKMKVYIKLRYEIKMAEEKIENPNYDEISSDDLTALGYVLKNVRGASPSSMGSLAADFTEE